MRRIFFCGLFLILLLLVAGCTSGIGNQMPHAGQPVVISNGSQTGSSGRAIAIAFKADELSTSSPESKESFIKGLMYLSQYGQYNESLQYFDQAIARDQNFTEAWFAKGVAFHNLKSYDEAIKCYDRALALNPSDAGVWHMKGITYEDWGWSVDAAECNRKAAALDPVYR